MSQQLIAFLRAINVGGHTVKMDRLRDLFGQMGFAHVETFIASGNVIFTTPDTDFSALEQKIELTLREMLGYEVATFIRTPAELVAIGHSEPFPLADLQTEGHGLYVAFVKTDPPPPAEARLQGFTTAIDAFQVRGREIYWLCRTKSSESTFSGAILEKSLGQSATLRNITTIKKLAAKYG
ncbi:MAG: DUF1697 domain-containing protein [Chloroflexi bacterium]|nr:DUF1697 domain-containing protein [Chloroflexota bacterium]MBP8056806.1 DUF1697 domain-containing protein [Chloroflexota bacterium]